MALPLADDPQVAILVTVDEADLYNDYGSVTAAPYAGQVLEQVLRYMQIKPQATGEKEYAIVPSTVGANVEYAVTKIENNGLLVEIEGTGTVVKQTPAAGEQVEKNTIVKIKCDTSVDTTVYYGIE